MRPSLKPLVRSVLNSTSHNRSKRGYVHYEDNAYGNPLSGRAPDAWEQGRSGSKKSGVQLGSLSHVYSGSHPRSTESQEMFGHQQDEEQYIAKTISVSVR